MYTQINPISKIEYTATIEDISMKLSIDRFTAAKNELVALTKHTHAYSELFVCISGQLIIEIEDRSITLDSGDAALVPADLSHHKLLKDTEAVWCSIGFLITTNRHRSVSKLSKRLSFWCVSKALTMRGIPEFCRDVYELRTNPTPPYDCVPAIAFTLLLLKYAETPQAASVTAIPQDSNMNRIALLETIVNAEFMTDIKLSTVSELLHISTRQLSRIVKKRFGTTFTRVIIHKRLETAAKLLIETDQTVEAIAAAVGFSSASFMHHTFKERYHMTPTAYRKSNHT